MTIKLLLILLAGICLSLSCYSQDSRRESDNILGIPAKFAAKANSRIASIEGKLEKQAARYLARLKVREARLKEKLAKKDSLAATTIFADAAEKYNSLEQKINTPQKYKEYVPYLDTLATSLRFLEQQKILSGADQVPQQLQSALSNIKSLESQLQKAETIKQFLKERKQFLREQLGKYGLGRELTKLNKDVYYYSQYVNEYKSLLQNPEKLERKAIELLTKTSVFQDFLRKHSFLASIFRISNDPGSAAYQANLAGLQTNIQVTQLIQQQFGTPGPNPGQAMQQNIQQAQTQLQQMKEKIRNLGGNENGDIPGFKVNPQKTRTFLQRLEVGTNIQTQKATNYFPTTSDIGLSLGYKLNDKSILGIGMAYSVGLGSGWRDIKLSSQGVGMRSFLDWRLHKSFWLSGGFEMNYRTAFNTVDQLKDLKAWQQSGLVGISKVVAMKARFLKKTKVSVLWDFLSYQQVPQTSAIKFRIGYSF
jgi:hypothetical protein